jgi:hypothetical protein
MEQARGEDDETEPKLGTHSWPGRNDVLLMAIQNEECDVVKDVVRRLKHDHPCAGVKAFVLPVEESF